MKVVLCGGSGHVGALLLRHFSLAAHELVVLSRSPNPLPAARTVGWDGKNLGPWASELDGADVVVNLAGRSVNCRYTSDNFRQMKDSRVDSTRVVGAAIRRALNPPRVWLQASTATIYAHRFDAANDEESGIIGGGESGVPPKWNGSIEIAKAWEAALFEAETPSTRKVAMRSAMTMSPDSGSVFDVLRKLARLGLGGTLGSGKQYVSWVHGYDFAQAVDFLIAREDLDGPINICSPNPLPQSEFMKVLRDAVKAPFGLPASPWMVEIGTFLARTESELVLKSRRVIPTRLVRAGFEFRFPQWKDACRDLAGAGA